jgi:hypothetical protein
VHIEMAVHEPHPPVVGEQPDDSPAVDGHGDRVPQGRIIEVELGSVGCCVEVAEALDEDVEVTAVDVDGVVLGGEDVGALEHDLHDGAVLELVDLGARHRLPKRATHVLRRVVELHQRVGREVGEDARRGVVCGVVVRLEDGESGRGHEGDVVDARREPRVVGPVAVLATAAVEEPQADGEEEVLVHA